ncbi:MAG: Hint domain-containing protein [Candidatus Acidiferrales bacterium]
MLNVPQIEALRKSNPQLYEALARIAGASLGPNQGWSLDDQITDGTNYARVVTGAITGGKIDPTKAGVLMKGSVPPTWSGAFTYVSTTTTITWTWSSLIIARADGTTTAVANSSLAVTGLTPGTSYYFYPYWDDAGLALAWVGALSGSAGAPANAFSAKTNAAAQQQALQGRIPLSQGAMIAATTTSGTGGGSGGGSGSCLRSGTMVLTRERGTVAIESCKAGEHLRCPGAAASEAWTRIVRLEVRDADTFIRLHFSNEESLDVTPHHIFTLADGSPMRAERLCLSDILVGRFGRLTLRKIEAVVEDSQKVTVGCEPTHQFYAGRHAAAILTHNYTFSS